MKLFKSCAVCMNLRWEPEAGYCETCASGCSIGCEIDGTALSTMEYPIDNQNLFSDFISIANHCRYFKLVEVKGDTNV